MDNLNNNFFIHRNNNQLTWADKDRVFKNFINNSDLQEEHYEEVFDSLGRIYSNEVEIFLEKPQLNYSLHLPNFNKDTDISELLEAKELIKTEADQSINIVNNFEIYKTSSKSFIVKISELSEEDVHSFYLNKYGVLEPISISFVNKITNNPESVVDIINKTNQMSYCFEQIRFKLINSIGILRSDIELCPIKSEQTTNLIEAKKRALKIFFENNSVLLESIPSNSTTLHNFMLIDDCYKFNYIGSVVKSIPCNSSKAYLDFLEAFMNFGDTLEENTNIVGFYQYSLETMNNSLYFLFVPINLLKLFFNIRKQGLLPFYRINFIYFFICIYNLISSFIIKKKVKL